LPVGWSRPQPLGQILFMRKELFRRFRTVAAQSGDNEQRLTGIGVKQPRNDGVIFRPISSGVYLAPPDPSRRGSLLDLPGGALVGKPEPQVGGSFQAPTIAE